MKLKHLISEIKDFPKEGIVYRDICPLIRDPDGWQQVISECRSICNELNPDIIVGIESRGFILGASLATSLKIGFVPIRKKGKLPGETISIEYELEYGRDSLEIEANLIKRNERVLIVDDLLATGGTSKAALELVKKTGAHAIGAVFIIELTYLKGRELLSDLENIYSLIKY